MPSRAARSLTENVPKPTRATLSPALRVSVIASTTAATAFAASLLERPAFSATAATNSVLFLI